MCTAFEGCVRCLPRCLWCWWRTCTETTTARSCDRTAAANARRWVLVLPADSTTTSGRTAENGVRDTMQVIAWQALGSGAAEAAGAFVNDVDACTCQEDVCGAFQYCDAAQATGSECSLGSNVKPTPATHAILTA